MAHKDATAGFPLVGELTDVELSFELADLPQSARDKLAQGPLPEPGCRVCRVLNTTSGGNLYNDPSYPSASVLMDYHDTPQRVHDGKVHEPAAGWDVYQRCLRIYKACGWTGALRS